MAGPYIYRHADFSARHAYIGVDEECVALVRNLTGAPQHLQWTEGAKVREALKSPQGIATGTAIATFVNGRYLSLPHGNHAALFVRATPDGREIVIFDQWRDHLPQQRTIYFDRPGHHSASNRAEAFSIIP
jgi:hypothetical protein